MASTKAYMLPCLLLTRRNCHVVVMLVPPWSSGTLLAIANTTIIVRLSIDYLGSRHYNLMPIIIPRPPYREPLQTLPAGAAMRTPESALFPLPRLVVLPINFTSSSTNSDLPACIPSHGSERGHVALGALRGNMSLHVRYHVSLPKVVQAAPADPKRANRGAAWHVCTSSYSSATATAVLPFHAPLEAVDACTAGFDMCRACHAVRHAWRFWPACLRAWALIWVAMGGFWGCSLGACIGRSWMSFGLLLWLRIAAGKRVTHG